MADGRELPLWVEQRPLNKVSQTRTSFFVKRRLSWNSLSLLILLFYGRLVDRGEPAV